MEKIEYKPEFINLIKDLTVINKTVIIQKKEEQAVSYRSDPDVTWMYNIEADPSYFNISDETKLGFYDFTEFFQFFMTFKNPDLFLDGNKIIFSNGASKGEYILSDVEMLTINKKYGRSAKIKFPKYDFAIQLNSTDISELVKLTGLIQPTRAKFYIKNNKFNIKLCTKKHENTFEKSFDFVNESGCEEDVDFDILPEIFEKLPSKNNYMLKIHKDGFILFTLINDNIKVNIFTGPIKG
jgi:DNA replicative helicase MCM subunit Mcm2 (Cdc46/Mcm family)